MDQFSSSGEFADVGASAAAGRDGGRDSLLLVAPLKLASMVAPITVRIRNLSSGGLMAEFAGRADIGDVVDVDVRGIGWIAGRVAWLAEGRMGVAFDREIDPKRARKPVAAPQRSPQPPKRAIL